MAKEIGTMGIGLKYATESTAGTKPSSGYTTLGNVKSIPALDAAASALDCTDLSDTVWKRYIPGLKDGGNDFAIGVNMVESNVTAWNALVTSAKTAYQSGKSTWFEITVPGWSNSFFLAGLPVEVGFAGADVDAIFEGTLHITPTAIRGWEAKTN